MDLSELTAAEEAGVGADHAILSTNVPWESLASAGLVSDAEVQSIRRVDKRDKFTQAALWEKARSLRRAATGVQPQPAARSLQRER